MSVFDNDDLKRKFKKFKKGLTSKEKNTEEDVEFVYSEKEKKSNDSISNENKINKFISEAIVFIKNPKVLLCIALAWYVEAPIIIACHGVFYKVSLLDLYLNPIKTAIEFFTSLSVMGTFLKFNFGLIIIFIIYCVVMHLAGKETGRIIDIEKLKMLSEITSEKEGEITFSKRGDFGTSKWATLKDIQSANKKEFLPCIEVSKEGNNGLIYGYFGDVKTPKKGSTPIVTLPKKTMYNRNFAVFGSSGSMKSRSFVIPNILNLIKNEESIFVTDPKGELLAKTYDVLVENGYNVKAFNINNIPCSDRWNVLKEIKNEQTASIFAKSIIENTKASGEKGDPFWDNHYVNFLKAIALYVRFNEPEERQNMATVYEYITYPDGFEGLDKLIGSAMNSEPNHPAAQSWIAFKTAAGNEKVSAGVMSGLAIKLDTLQIPAFRDLLSGSDIDLTAPGKEKCAYFVVVPDTHSTFNFLAGLFFTFAFINLIDFADKLGDALPYQVNFLLDEFPNIAKIPDIEKKISTVRSRGVSICVIFQALSQLSSRYSKEIAEEILANCDNKIFLGANEMTTASSISEMLGDATIEVETKSQEAFSMFASRRSTSVAKRRLRTPEEVLGKPKNNSYIILPSIPPILATKMDYTNHSMGHLIREHNIYDMLKDWSKPYHEQYLEGIREQLLKVINQYDNNNYSYVDDFINSETNNLKKRNEDEIKKEISLKTISVIKNKEDKSKMEKALEVINEKLKLLREEERNATKKITEEIENYKFKIANGRLTEELIMQYSEELEELKTSSDSEQIKEINKIKISLQDILEELKNAVTKINAEKIDSILNTFEEDNNIQKTIKEIVDIDTSGFSKGNINSLERAITKIIKQSTSIIKKDINNNNFELVRQNINSLFSLDLTDEQKAKIDALEEEYNKLSEKAFNEAANNEIKNINTKEAAEKDNVEINNEEDNGLPINSDENPFDEEDVPFDDEDLPFDDFNEGNRDYSTIDFDDDFKDLDEFEKEIYSEKEVKKEYKALNKFSDSKEIYNEIQEREESPQKEVLNKNSLKNKNKVHEKNRDKKIKDKKSNEINHEKNINKRDKINKVNNENFKKENISKKSKNKTQKEVKLNKIDEFNLTDEFEEKIPKTRNIEL